MRPLTDGFKTLVRGFGYVAGFLLLNLLLGHLGAGPFKGAATSVLGQSLLGRRLVDGFDLSVLGELLGRPELGPSGGVFMTSSLLFAVATLLLMPGVLQAYAAGGRIPREAFLASCGHHVWRFLRLAVLFVLGAGTVGGLLGAASAAAVKAADRSTLERLPFWMGLGAFLAVLVVMTLLRLWFDLAQAHVVVRDQKAVRRSLAAAFRLLRAHGLRLLGLYLLITLLAGLALAGGGWVWWVLVPARSLAGAFLVGQVVLLLLLAARFWQRAAAVAVVVAAR